jgi:cytochrome b561
MRKWIQNYLLFLFLVIMMLCQIVSGFILWLALDSGLGYQGGRDQVITDAGSFLSWTRHQWIDFHDWTAVTLVALVILHLVLHWKWIVYTTKKAFTLSQ